MTKIHMCPKCAKVLANRHSLSRHKKNCRGGSVLPFKHSDLLENEKKRLSYQLNPQITMFPENDVSSDESIKSDTESVDSNDLVWRRLVFMADGDKTPVLEDLVSLLSLYKQKGNELLEKMLSDVEYAKGALDYSEDKAFEYTLAKNKDEIMRMIGNCAMHKDNNLWCALAGRRRKPDCQWFIGERCGCCHGTSVLDWIGEHLKIYYGMQHDELLRKIIDEIDARIGQEEDFEELAKVITDIVEEHQKEIMEEVNLARDTIGDNEWKEDKEIEDRTKNFKIDYCDCKKD